MCQYWKYPEETEIIHFCKEGREGAFGQTENGIMVFVDRDVGVHVEKGDTWICRLVRNTNPNKKIYWAWPIEKLEEKKEETIATGYEITDMSVDNMDTLDKVLAIGNDSISSGLLTNERYVAYRSLNGAFMELIADSKGDIVCKDNTVSVNGLDTFIGSEFPVALDFTCKENKILIKLIDLY